MRLRDEGCRITDVAFELGFGSVDGYQRAFFRAFGCNPGEYAAKPVPLCLFVPYGVRYRELRKEPKKMENVKTVFIQRVEKPARKVILKRGVKARDYFAYCEEVGCDVWGTLTSMKSLCGEPVCLWLTPEQRAPGTSEYVQVRGAIEKYDPACLGYVWDARTQAYNWSPWVTGAILSCCPCGPQSAEPYRGK